MMQEHDLGTRIDRFAVNNRRRGAIALVSFALGLVVTGLFLALAIPAYASSVAGDDVVPSVGVGCGLGLLLVAVWQGCLFATRSDENFDLHEHGLVHSYGKKTRAIEWNDVADLVDRSKDTAFARALGGNVSYQVATTSGTSVTITGLTERAEYLTDAVRRAVENRG